MYKAVADFVGVKAQPRVSSSSFSLAASCPVVSTPSMTNLLHVSFRLIYNSRNGCLMSVADKQAPLPTLPLN